jgi:hypothetical protein
MPGFFLSGVIALLVFGFTAGALRLFLLGDNPWPASIETILPFLLLLVFPIAWLATTTLGFVIGKHLEANPVLQKSHILISFGLTLLAVLLILSYQWSVGNTGPQSAGLRCSDYCSLNGYSASSLPPLDSGDRTCSCLDNLGREAIKIPIDQIR